MNNVLEMIADESMRSYSLCEEVLEQVAREDREPTFDEKTFFQSKIGWDEREIRSQVFRMKAVERSRNIAGTEIDRKNVNAELAQAQESLASERPKLLAKIAELQAKLSAIEQQVSQSQSRVDAMATACEYLTSPDALPLHVRKRIDAELCSLRDELWSELTSAESEAKLLDSICNSSDFMDENVMGLVRFYFPECIAATRSMEQLRYSSLWPAKLDELRSKLQKLKPRAIALRSEYSQREQEIRLSARYYLN